MKFTKSSGGNTLMKRALALLFVLVMVCALVVPAYATESGSVEGETTPATEGTVDSNSTGDPTESPVVESESSTEQSAQEPTSTEQPTQESEQTAAPEEEKDESENTDTEVQEPESADESNIATAALNDDISLASISGDTTIKVTGTTTLTGTSGNDHSWSSND